MNRSSVLAAACGLLLVAAGSISWADDMKTLEGK